jgi:hypothetical protein
MVAATSPSGLSRTLREISRPVGMRSSFTRTPRRRRGGRASPGATVRSSRPR